MKKVIKRFIPKKLLEAARRWRTKNTIAKIHKYYENHRDVPPEITEHLKQMNEVGVFAYNYNLLEKYINRRIQVHHDKNKDLPYIIQDDRKLYFSRELGSDTEIAHYYNIISAEQDSESPHCYFSGNLDFDNCEVLLDIGAAEGNLAFSVVDRVKKVYVFECENNFVEALSATFESYGDKVEIVRKYVSDKNNKNETTIDEFLRNKPYKSGIIKMDIEGFEMLALSGAIETLRDKNFTFIVAAYHRSTDETEIPTFLSKFNYECRLSKGYLLAIFLERRPPYFRRCLVFADKTKGGSPTHATINDSGETV